MTFPLSPPGTPPSWPDLPKPAGTSADPLHKAAQELEHELWNSGVRTTL